MIFRSGDKHVWSQNSRQHLDFRTIVLITPPWMLNLPLLEPLERLQPDLVGQQQTMAVTLAGECHMPLSFPNSHVRQKEEGQM